MGQPMGELRFNFMMAADAEKKRARAKRFAADLPAQCEKKPAFSKTGPLGDEEMQASLRTLSYRAYIAIVLATENPWPTIIDFKAFIDANPDAFRTIAMFDGVGPKTIKELMDFAYLHGLCALGTKPFEDLTGRERAWMIKFFKNFDIGCKDDLAQFIKENSDWEWIFVRESYGCGPVRLSLIKAYVAEHIPAQDSGTTP